MNLSYSEYINGPAWKAKREEKLRQVGRRCECCGSSNRLEVHHLTYVRLFHEDLNDLMVLCFYHHMAAEECASNGEVRKKGDPLRLRSKTLKLLQEYGTRKERQKSENIPSNRTQEKLMQEPWLAEAMKQGKKEFKKIVRKHLGNYSNFSSIMANGIAIYNRARKHKNHKPAQSKEHFDPEASLQKKLERKQYHARRKQIKDEKKARALEANTKVDSSMVDLILNFSSGENEISSLGIEIKVGIGNEPF
jgi:hypothetical protein